MARAVKEGRKCCTTRGTVRGAPGDVFDVGGVCFRLIDVVPVPLIRVRDELYRQEGFGSLEEFEKTWRGICWGKWAPDKICYVHYFARCQNATLGD